LNLYTHHRWRYRRVTEVRHERLPTHRGTTAPARTATPRCPRRGPLPPHFGRLGSGRWAAHCRNRPVASHEPGQRVPLDRLLPPGARPDGLGRPPRGQSSHAVDRGPPGGPRRHLAAAADPLRLPGGGVDRPPAPGAPGELAGRARLRDVDPPATARAGVHLAAAPLRAGPRPGAREKNAASGGRLPVCRRAG
jgi:hypothetical protein